MPDRREEILLSEFSKLVDENGMPNKDALNDSLVFKSSAIRAMDDYMKECCLELLEYMAKNDVNCTWYDHEVNGRIYTFSYKGEDISKEQLFENFL